MCWRLDRAEVGRASAATVRPPPVVVAFAKSAAGTGTWAVSGGATRSRLLPSRSVTTPRRDRALYLRSAKCAHVGVDGPHQRQRRCSLDGGHVGSLVMRATRANWDHGALEEASDTFDYVAVSHRDAHNWNSPSGTWRGEERAPAFEDPYQPEDV